MTAEKIVRNAFETNGINAFFAVIAAKISFSLAEFSEWISALTAIFVLIYTAALALTSVLRFIRDARGAGSVEKDESERGN